MKKPAIVWLLLAVAFVSAGAALIPLLRDRPMNVTFLALAAFWFIIAMAVAAKGRSSAAGEGDRTP